jgi:hypothetical protein
MDMVTAPPKAPSADFTSTTIGKIEEPPPAAPPKKKEKKAERKAAPMEDTFRAEPRAATADRAPAIEVPREEAERKKSPMGMILGGVAALAVVGVIAFILLKPKPADNTSPGGTNPPVADNSGGNPPAGGPGGGGTAPPLNPAPGPAPAVDSWTTAEGKKTRTFITDSRKLAAKGDFAAASKKLDEAERLGGAGAIAEAIRTERATITKMSTASAAEREAMNKAGDQLSQIATLMQTRSEDSLNRALGMANTGVSAGVRADEFRKAKTDIEASLNSLHAENERKPIFDDAQRALRSENYSQARLKAREFQGKGGDGALLASIQTAEQSKKSQLDGLFDRYKSANDQNRLGDLIGEYKKLDYEGGPFASDARDMASNRIPAEISRIRTPAKTEVAVSKQPVQPAAVSCTASFKRFSTDQQVYKGPMPSAGRLMAESFIDGGMVLAASPVPPDVLKQGCGKSVRLRLDVDENGAVTGGTVQTGDAALGAQLVTAAKSEWKFNAPKISNIPVKTNTVYVVSFQ